MQELIDLPAPRLVNKSEDEKRHSSEFYDAKNPPSNDAPIEDLLNYWRVMAGANHSANNKPLMASMETCVRLLGVVEATPYKFNGFLKILSLDSEVTESVKRLYDSKQDSDDVSDY